MQTIKLIFALACALLLAGRVSAQESTLTQSTHEVCEQGYAVPWNYHTAHITDTDGKPIKNVRVYTMGYRLKKSDDHGLFVTILKYGWQYAFHKEGYKLSYAKALCDSTIRVTLYPNGISKFDCIEQEPLQKKFEQPIYVVNGKYIADFKHNNYTRKDFTAIKTSNKWNKLAQQTFAGTSFDKIDIEKRGVVYLTLKRSIPLYPTNKKSSFNDINKYSIIITDHKGMPVKDVSLFDSRRKAISNEDGVVSFQADKKEDTPTIFVGSNRYEPYIMMTPANTTEHHITLQPAKKEKQTRPIMPSFKGGSVHDFSKWIGDQLKPIYKDIVREYDSEVKAVFVVGKSGKIVSVRIIKSNNDDLSREAKRILYNSPTWKPGTYNGKAISVKYSVPIRVHTHND